MSHRLPHRQHHLRCQRRHAPRGRLAGSLRSAAWSPRPTGPEQAPPARRSPLRSRAPGWPWARAWEAGQGHPARGRLARPPRRPASPRRRQKSSSAALFVPPARRPWPRRHRSSRSAGSALCRPRRNQSDSTDSKMGSRLPWPSGPAGGTTTSRRGRSRDRCRRGSGLAGSAAGAAGWRRHRWQGRAERRRPCRCRAPRASARCSPPAAAADVSGRRAAAADRPRTGGLGRRVSPRTGRRAWTGRRPGGLPSPGRCDAGQRGRPRTG